MAVENYERLTMVPSKIETIEDIKVIFTLLGVTFNIPEKDMNLPEILAAKEKGVLVGQMMSFDSETRKTTMLENTVEQMKKAVEEAQNNTKQA